MKTAFVPTKGCLPNVRRAVRIITLMNIHKPIKSRGIVKPQAVIEQCGVMRTVIMHFKERELCDRTLQKRRQQSFAAIRNYLNASRSVDTDS